MVSELDIKIQELRTLKDKLNKQLYNTKWKRDEDAEPLIEQIEKVSRQLNKLRKQKDEERLLNYQGEIVKEVAGSGLHVSNLRLKDFMFSCM